MKENSIKVENTLRPVKETTIRVAVDSIAAQEITELRKKVKELEKQLVVARKDSKLRIKTDTMTLNMLNAIQEFANKLEEIGALDTGYEGYVGVTTAALEIKESIERARRVFEKK
jgi:hypothetical protein